MLEIKCIKYSIVYDEILNNCKNIYKKLIFSIKFFLYIFFKNLVGGNYNWRI